ncbi:hypothetical protein IMG5_005550 [Ichthyophthirius multifiliis]|uniref:Ciliary microtubule inner protein 2A-C-like domain-containing protein n=1 Tax=Ichthyophthirius multifiliis TaxID=5932 RepID=G0QJI2_ICHMU|nr:hypothetical protein IMG5_005550 [Ichthyophthirius multifiliis]EGR34633.1 hypothetical protein IMG5_005550 [Ichthyophthirius multifiliis]|eukprot:XP_004039937.1 hypothetical protein IMG5_005550 [Ichthyophthirius multifiliis]
MSQYAYDYDPAKTQKYQKNQISNEKFSKWTKENLYRTSYVSHWSNKPLEPKSHVPPGYAGYIPQLLPNNEYGASYGKITQKCLDDPKLSQNPFKLASTGFNYRRHDFKDTSRKAYSHKYGCQTIITNHPAVEVESKDWVSQTKDTFRNPKNRVNPTYRETDKQLQTQKNFTKTSGFQQNHTCFDGTGWVPDKILNGKIFIIIYNNYYIYIFLLKANRTLSEYRIHYNTKVPFHRETNLFKTRQLQRKEYNYKHMG